MRDFRVCAWPGISPTRINLPVGRSGAGRSGAAVGRSGAAVGRSGGVSLPLHASSLLSSALPVGWELKYHSPLKREHPFGVNADDSPITAGALGSRLALALSHSASVPKMVSGVHWFPGF